MTSNIAGVIAFILSSRVSVRVTTPSRSSRRISSVVMRARL
jgi:hypothetical protein